MNKKGFTIVEILIATAVFSMILVTISVGYLQIARGYHKGRVIRQTQQNARFILEDMIRYLRSGGDPDVYNEIFNAQLEQGLDGNFSAVRKSIQGKTAYEVTVVVATEDDFDGDTLTAACDPSLAGSQFCSVTKFTTLVTPR